MTNTKKRATRPINVDLPEGAWEELDAKEIFSMGRYIWIEACCHPWAPLRHHPRACVGTATLRMRLALARDPSLFQDHIDVIRVGPLLRYIKAHERIKRPNREKWSWDDDD